MAPDSKSLPKQSTSRDGTLALQSGKPKPATTITGVQQCFRIREPRWGQVVAIRVRDARLLPCAQLAIPKIPCTAMQTTVRQVLTVGRNCRIENVIDAAIQHDSGVIGKKQAGPTLI